MSVDITSLIAGFLFGIIVAMVIYLIDAAYKEDQAEKKIHTQHLKSEISRLDYSIIQMLKRVLKIEERLAELESDDNDEQTD